MLAWRVAPTRTAARTVALVLSCLIWFPIGHLAFGSILPGLLGAALIVGSTMEYWSGSNFRLDAEAATSRVGPSPTVLRWEEVQYAGPFGDGILLSPLKGGKRPQFRGVWLRLADNREEVVRWIRERLPEGAEDALG